MEKMIVDMLNSSCVDLGDKVTVKPKKSKPGKDQNYTAFLNPNTFISSFKFNATVIGIYARFYVLRTKAGYVRCISKQDILCGDYEIVKKGGKHD